MLDVTVTCSSYAPVLVIINSRGSLLYVPPPLSNPKPHYYIKISRSTIIISAVVFNSLSLSSCYPQPNHANVYFFFFFFITVENSKFSNALSNLM